MKLLSKLFITTGLLITTESYAVGIDSQKLIWPCEGTITLKEVLDHGKTNGFTDRGGNFHPPKGYAYLKAEITDLSKSCEIFQKKLGLDLNKMNFEHYLSFVETDLPTVLNLAGKEIGKEFPFQTKQNFSYQDKNGYLPFFPLIHKEWVTIESDLFFFTPHFLVDTQKVYNIKLSEEEKIELSKLIFNYLDQEDLNGIQASSLFDAVLENHPQFERNFKEFISKILVYYNIFENQYDKKTLNMVNENITQIASHIRNLSFKYPQVYALDIPNLLANHPSLVNYSSWKTDKKTCLNISAIQLEETLEIISERLAANSIHPSVKKNWQDILKVIAGGLWNSGISSCVEHLVSKSAKETALQLLKTNY